ncbi:MAG: heme-binding protein, partial [Betaproteobacteria bacterium]|nr:heme-binding protein [Betaproteobacteria bacterium]
MLTLEDCRKISAAAETEARKNNWNVCIAILDDGGHLLHLVRMDGASPANARIAVEKGRTAAQSRRSTAAWQERIRTRPELLRMPEITPVQGGLPIMVPEIRANLDLLDRMLERHLKLQQSLGLEVKVTPDEVDPIEPDPEQTGQPDLARMTVNELSVLELLARRARGEAVSDEALAAAFGAAHTADPPAL